MKALRELAAKLLADGTVQVVVGYEEGPRGVRPAFVTRPEEAQRLLFDGRCVQNLTTYLNPRRPHLARLGKAAVVVKGCDARAAAGLLRESQLKRDDVVLLGVRCGGVYASPDGTGALTAETVADRCAGCACREPKRTDHLVGELPPAPPESSRRDAKLAELEARPPADRWAFWTAELAKCVRCHACREVCPLCTCERCVADKTQPQWIESSPHLRGNLAWQVTRVLHLAGRCADCGECERACPVGIPLNLLARKMAKTVEANFAYRATDDPAVPAPVGAFQMNDPQEFIR